VLRVRRRPLAKRAFVVSDVNLPSQIRENREAVLHVLTYRASTVERFPLQFSAEFRWGSCFTRYAHRARRFRRLLTGLWVRLGGGVATIREYLQAGLVEEMHLGVSPTLLGKARLFCTASICVRSASR
jgi:hypothetical protein